MRTEYIPKGTPNKPHPTHKGDFKVLKELHQIRKETTNTLDYYRSIMLYFKLQKNNFVEYSGQLQ